MQFTVSAVLDAVAAAIPDRVLLTQGDRRYTYADVVDRSNRLASYLHSRGLGCHTARPTLAGHESGRTTSASTLQRQRVPRGDARRVPGPGRAVQRQLPLRRGGAAVPARRRRRDRARLPRRVRAALAEVLPDLPQLRVLLQVADDSGNDLLAGAVDYEDALAVGARRRRRSSRRPTTSTSSTPAARPACPRACCGASTTSS